MKKMRYHILLAFVAAWVVLSANVALAGVVIPGNLDQPGLRTSLGPIEGYLSFHYVKEPYGEERTGWTDIRHPAQASLAGTPGAEDKVDGFDRSDHFVNVRTTTLTDADPPGPAGPTVAPNGGIPDDFDFANKAWAQAGLSVIEIATRAIPSPAAGAGSFSFPLSLAEEQTIMTSYNAAGAQMVEVYYTNGLDSGAYAETWYPTLLDGPGNKDEAIFMANTGVAANPRRNTLAHELGHFLLDGEAVHDPIAGPGEPFQDVGPDGVPGTGDSGEGNGSFDPREPFSDFGVDGVPNTNDFGEGEGSFTPPDTSHSSDPRNIVAAPQWDPGSTAGESGREPFQDVGPDGLPGTGDPGEGNGSFDPGEPFSDFGFDGVNGTSGSGEGNGTFDQSPSWDIADSIDVIGRAMSTNLNGSPKVGGTNQIEISQIQTVFSDPDVAPWLNIPNDNGLTYGDVADFDWVEDNIWLEIAGGNADNHPGFDWLVWEIGPIAYSSHTEHDHGDWGELDLPAYSDETFRYIDVVSQISRYADTDVDAAGNLSRREAALDYYIPEFSFDGQNWQTGTLVTVFKDGWTTKSRAEDYVARFYSPIAAKYMRLQASALIGFDDRNVQIDAIIASPTPVPGAVLLGTIGIGLVGLLQGRRRP